MARRPKQKLLTAIPARFDPNFMDRLNRNYSLANVVLGRRSELESHLGGVDQLTYVQRSMIKRLIWLELLTERYEQQVANGEPVDIGALTQLNNTLKGLYKDLGIDRRAKPVRKLRDVIDGGVSSNQ